MSLSISFLHFQTLHLHTYNKYNPCINMNISEKQSKVHRCFPPPPLWVGFVRSTTAVGFPSPLRSMLLTVVIAEPPSPSMYLFALHKTLFTAQKSPKPFESRKEGRKKAVGLGDLADLAAAKASAKFGNRFGSCYSMPLEKPFLLKLPYYGFGNCFSNALEMLSIEGGSDTQAAHMNEICKTESAEKKETSEVKRKNTKRTFKSEKEFLEFTLKYQQVLSERDAAIAVRDKLESLCRELQRQNKMLMVFGPVQDRDGKGLQEELAAIDCLCDVPWCTGGDVNFVHFPCEQLGCDVLNRSMRDECKRVSTEGQNLRLDLSNKFQDAIKTSFEEEKKINHARNMKEVSHKLEEQKDESLSQLKENEMLRIKLKQLADQYALSEQQYVQKLKQKTLELQIADLKTQQHEEKLLQEQSQLKFYAEQVSELLANEKNLRLQLTADGEKFQQFQDALVKSNEVFETFKQEIEKMAKSIKQLKKENAFLKSKSEKSDITLIELVEEREHLKKQLEKTKNQKEKLESLCRSLHAERKQNSTGGGSNTDSVAV
ncbi:unnamed protein product [Camellia sinensis]